VWAVGGCAPRPCEPGAAPPLLDPDGAARPGLLDEIAAGFEAFARWSGGPAPCVPAVRVEAQLRVAGAPADGWRDARTGALTIDAAAPDAARTALHELCHAWDAATGRPSADPAFDALSALPAHPAYPDPTARRREAFARACARGPVETALLHATSGCGPDPAPLDALRARLWVAAGPPVWTATVSPSDPPADLPLDALLAGGHPLEAAPCGDAICVVAVGIGPPLLPAAHPYDRLRQGLVVLDPSARAVRAVHPMPRREESGWSLLGGPDGALLLEATDSPRAWWISGEGITPTAAPPLRAGTSWSGTASVAGAWAETPAGVVGLEGGAWRPAPSAWTAPPWPVDGWGVARPEPGAPDGGVVLAAGAHRLPLPVVGLTGPAAGLPGGPLRVGAGSLGIAAADPDAASLWLPRAACDGGAAAGAWVGASPPWRLARDPDRIEFLAVGAADRPRRRAVPPESPPSP